MRITKEDQEQACETHLRNIKAQWETPLLTNNAEKPDSNCRALEKYAIKNAAPLEAQRQ